MTAPRPTVLAVHRPSGAFPTEVHVPDFAKALAFAVTTDDDLTVDTLDPSAPLAFFPAGSWAGVEVLDFEDVEPEPEPEPAPTAAPEDLVVGERYVVVHDDGTSHGFKVGDVVRVVKVNPSSSGSARLTRVFVTTTDFRPGDREPVWRYGVSAWTSGASLGVAPPEAAPLYREDFRVGDAVEIVDWPGWDGPGTFDGFGPFTPDGRETVRVRTEGGLLGSFPHRHVRPRYVVGETVVVLEGAKAVGDEYSLGDFEEATSVAKIVAERDGDGDVLVAADGMTWYVDADAFVRRLA